MRFALLAVCLGGCLIDSPSSGSDQYPPSGNGWGSGYGGGGGDTGFGCHQDSECGGTGYVCARDGECLSTSQVRVVHVNWTVSGSPASASTCTHAPDLSITFMASSNEQFGFAPVPCDSGRYTIDKFPTRFTQVQLARSGEYGGGAASSFDATGNASLDLRY